MPADLYQHYQTHLTAPYIGGADVTPADDADLTSWARGLVIESTGTVKMTMADGSVITRTCYAAGTEWYGRVRRVWATGTTATNIKAFW